MQHEDTFRAMDTDVDVIIEADERPIGAFLAVRLLFANEEQLFSRFLPESLLSRLNRGEAIRDATFAQACQLALRANDETGGLFHPLTLEALEFAGYDRTFGEIGVAGRPGATTIPPLGECLRVDGEEVTVRGARLDLGGIIKGWTVDLAARHVATRHPAALVNAGGDLQAVGREAGAEGWRITIEAAAGGRPPWEGHVRGGLATSTSLRRRWSRPDGGVGHHLIDPRTGQPAESPFVQVSVFAPETWRAEIWAKAVLIGGRESGERCAAAGLRALAIEGSGKTVWIG